MNLNGEKRTAPAVEAIVEMFPEDFLGNTVRENGLIIRERKIDPVILFRVLTPGFGVRFLSTIRGLKRKYEEKAGVKLSISSFYERFTPEMVDFLQWCVLHAIEFQAQQPGRVLGDKYFGWDPGSRAASCSSSSDTSSTSSSIESTAMAAISLAG